MNNRLKELRQAAGISQAELAKRSGVNKRMIEHYEQGFKDLSKAAFETGLRIAEALEADPRDLLPKKDLQEGAK